MKRLPIYNLPGQYCYIARNLDELTIIEAGDDIIYSVNFDSSKSLRINETIARMIEKPYLPMWLEDSVNFERILNNSFNEITPLSAEIIPSFNCPFQCEECSYRPIKERIGVWGKYINTPSIMMDKKTCEIVLENLRDYGVKHIVITGGGEPLTNIPTVLHCMDLCNQYGIKFGLYTNGLFLSPECAKEIILKRPEFIRISVYGMSKERFNDYTNSSSNLYAIIVNNIKSILPLNLCSDDKNHIHISLSFLVHPKLIQDSKDIRKLLDVFSLEELSQFFSIRFTPVVDYYTDKQFPKRYFDEIVTEVLKLSKDFHLSNIVIYDHRIEDLYVPKDYTQCFGNGLYAEVGPDGTMYLCCEYIGRDAFKLGNLRNQSIGEIWSSSKRYESIKRIGDCSSCPKVCKPHEINKQINRIVRIGNRLKREELTRWRKDLINISKDSGFYPGKLNAYES